MLCLRSGDSECFPWDPGSLCKYWLPEIPASKGEVLDVVIWIWRECCRWGGAVGSIWFSRVDCNKSRIYLAHTIPGANSTPRAQIRILPRQNFSWQEAKIYEGVWSFLVTSIFVSSFLKNPSLCLNIISRDINMSRWTDEHASTVSLLFL